MPLQISPPPGETIERLREAILSRLPEAEVSVDGSGGHFEIQVVSQAFAGEKTLARQRMIYSAIAHLMSGDNPPVHAIDRLQTSEPEDSIAR